MADIEKMTKTEFMNLPNKKLKGYFNNIIIVPMNELHDSGYRCMKFILCMDRDIVGVVSGWSDVMHFDGIGGYGRNLGNFYNQARRMPSYSIDCLPKSRLIRVMTHELLEAESFVGSDFIFYRKEG